MRSTCCRLLFLFAIGVSLFAQGTRGYYRYPTIHGDEIVFTSEGDLWRVGTNGGQASRLTTHPGEESMAAFSPDGSMVAFSATYEGPREVYTMPATGGLPVRRTYDGANAVVVGWTPDGKILYSTSRYAPLPGNMQLLTIDKDNHQGRVPLSRAEQGVYAPGGRTLFFTRFQKQSSSTKRYQGGTAENIWKITGDSEAVPLTANYAGTSKNAMVWKDRVYFLCDRDGVMNLWSMNEEGKDLKQLTKHQGFDIQSASLWEGKIVYSMAGDLRLFDMGSGADKAVAVELASDFDNLREHWVKNPSEYLTSAHISNDGSSLVLTARGRVFVAPAKSGRFVDLNPNQAGRFREARMMPDKKSVLLVSTESGETELWKYPANGDGRGEPLTKGATVLRWEGVPSPDGKLIAHQDRNQRLSLLDVAAKTDKKIAETNSGDLGRPSFGALRWSPDGKWLAFTENAANDFLQIYLYSLETGKTTTLTRDRYNSGSMAWSPDGKWLYFISDRHFKTSVQSPWGVRQPDPFFDHMDEIYAVSLKKGAISPFEPADELHMTLASGGAEAAKPVEKSAEKPAGVKVEIDLDGIGTRLQPVPVPPGNYSALFATEKRLCWVNRDRDSSDKNALECIDIGNKNDNKPQKLMEGVRQVELSGDGKKMMVAKRNDFFVFDSSVSEGALKDPKTTAEAQVDLKSWTFSVIPEQEFREAFFDAWRLHRDYFYDPDMHKVNWPLMRDKYAELLNRVRDREELSEVLAQMVGELSVLHTFVRGGDLRKGSDEIGIGSLGAFLRRDEGSKGFVVDHIYRTDPDQPDKLSPLLREGVTIQEGDLITEIDGRSLAHVVSAAEPLRNTAGRQVLLSYLPKGKTEVQHTVVKPMPVSAETDLLYTEWEYTRRKAVEEASGGKMAYIHLRAMGPADIERWEEEYTPIYDREGLIIDVRHNRGGNIDSWLLDRLSRKAWMYWQARRGQPTWNMQEAFRGRLVVICDEDTASDGEAFAEGFRRLGLGKIVGTRTWGGEIWLSSDNVLADKGIASAAETGVFGPDGKWLIEGHGVDPDITVDNLPHAAFEGKDAQLEAAIAYLQGEVQQHPVTVPPHPAYPDKSIKATGGGAQ